MSGKYARELDKDGKDVGECWIADPGSPFRSLTAQEVLDLREMAEKARPTFGGKHNAEWEAQHPVAREVWEKHGHKPS